MNTPTTKAHRVQSLDSIRGIAVMGILLMNAVSFGLVDPAYFNLNAGGTSNWFDRLIGGFGEVFVDQKFMGLFSMLFGAGIILFVDRAETRSKHPIWLSLWRNALLLLIGILHSLLWDGDVLIVYALCAPVLLLLRKTSVRWQLIVGVVIFLVPAALVGVVQSTVGVAGVELGSYWSVQGLDSNAVADTMSDEVGLWLLVDFFARALGMMLIGMAFYRSGVLTGQRPNAWYRKMATVGLAVGIPLGLLSWGIFEAASWSPDIALLATIPNSLGTIPMVFAYMAVITLWDRDRVGRAVDSVRAVGRMALTNYLAQTVLGVLVLGTIAENQDLTRSAILLFAVVVWSLQLAWSPWWLNRFRYGPAEWAWRCGTYRTFFRLRRRPAEEQS